MSNAREKRSVARGLRATEALFFINATLQKAVTAEPTASAIVKTTVKTASPSVPSASKNELITKSPEQKKRFLIKVKFIVVILKELIIA